MTARVVAYDVSRARGAPPKRPSPTLRTLVRLELTRLLRLKRPWIGLLVVVAIPVAMTLSLYLTSHPPEPGEGPPFLFESLRNGLFIPYVALTVMIHVLLPAVIALVAADAIAGEAASGTLRALLSRPVTRGRVLAAKWILAAIWAWSVVWLQCLVALAVGTAFFGVHDTQTLIYGLITVERALAAMLLAHLYAWVCMLGVIGVALAVSVLTSSPIGAFFGTLAAIVVESIVGALPSFGIVRPFLITQHFETWQKLVREPPDYAAYGRGLICPAIYAVVGVAFAYWRFRRDDVVS